jgi:hypothetical protein
MSYLGLKAWVFMWSGKSHLPCSRWFTLHGLTSSDLGLRTWNPCELALNNVKVVLIFGKILLLPSFDALLRVLIYKKRYLNDGCNFESMVCNFSHILLLGSIKWGVFIKNWNFQSIRWMLLFFMFFPQLKDARQIHLVNTNLTQRYSHNYMRLPLYHKYWV